jgi:hypothetical protein
LALSARLLIRRGLPRRRQRGGVAFWYPRVVERSDPPWKVKVESGADALGSSRPVAEFVAQQPSPADEPKDEARATSDAPKERPTQERPKPECPTRELSKKKKKRPKQERPKQERAERLPATEPDQYVLVQYGPMAADSLARGGSEERAYEELRSYGLSKRDARFALEFGREMLTARRERATRDKLHGALWAGGGLLVTVLTYSAASEGGGGYVVTWGAMLYGAYRLIRGFAG